jgi:hypothetical protein
VGSHDFAAPPLTRLLCSSTHTRKVKCQPYARSVTRSVQQDGDKSSNVHGHSHGQRGNNLPQPSGLLRASRRTAQARHQQQDDGDAHGRSPLQARRLRVSTATDCGVGLTRRRSRGEPLPQRVRRRHRQPTHVEVVMGTTPTETGRAPFDTTARARKGDGSAAPESPRWARCPPGGCLPPQTRGTRCPSSTSRRS